MADKAKTKPKKKPFMTIGIPGGRRTLGGGPPGASRPSSSPTSQG
jgi:hypothetical protein